MSTRQLASRNKPTQEMLLIDESGNSAGGSPNTIVSNQVTVNATATPIVAARASRRSVTIVNGGTTDVFLGATGVTVANGLLLTGTKGASITLHTTAAVFGIASTGTQVVSFMESY